MKSVLYSALASVLIIVSCRSAEDSAREAALEEPEIVLFSEIQKPDSVINEVPPADIIIPDVKTETDTSAAAKPVEKFYIQVGAFNTDERAKLFISQNQSKIPYLMNIAYRESDRRYLVRLKAFSSKDDAELVKNDIRRESVFKDAFITEGER